MSSPLRTWLKNEGIFDADLEVILTEQGINDPSTDFKTLSQSKWDEIVRLATVARAKDIKDNKARMRMEEKLTKIEAFWRQESGIEKTTIKADSAAAKGSKETKNVPLKSQEEEKDALNNAGELKKWMQKEEIWEKDLFLVLTQHKITCEDEIATINSQPAFDEIIREVTVLRRDDNKDKDAKMRLEKLLTKFEKLWRAKTGIEKTNINANSKASKTSQDTKNTPLKSQEDEKDALNNAGELKKWMQKEEIWEKDLFLILTQHKITSEDDIATIDSQPAFDEIIREVTVLRRDDIKDNDAKMRLEKLLAKFEKLWRAKTGIEKTNINPSSKATKSDQDTKNTPLKSQEEEKDALNNAGELKKWMQKEEIWEKDLFLVLTQHKITCEDDIATINSQPAFDEIIREVTVLRRDDIKDNDAKMRLEKLLAKFEKIWRSKTGIEKTNLQGASDKKKGPAPIESENEKMATTGKSLKTWMQNNEIWEKALFDELLANNIKDENDVATLTETQFDEITRKVRVDRFSNMKDQASRQRLDKLLINFERLWREKSGVQKSNLKK